MTQPTTIWKVNSLKRKLDDGWVFWAEFQVTATENGVSADTIGSVTFKRPETLIPYEELTEALVLDWIKTELNDVPGADAVTNIENELYKNIKQIQTPTEEYGVPWPLADAEVL